MLTTLSNVRYIIAHKGETVRNTNQTQLRQEREETTLPEWNEADIIDSVWSEGVSFHSGTNFYAHDDDTSRYPADDDSDDNDALEDYLNSFFDEVNQSAVDDASPYDDNDNDDESPYFNDYSSIEIDYDAYPSEIDTNDDDDTIAEAVSAYLDLHL